MAAPFLLTLTARPIHAGAGTLGTYAGGYGETPGMPPEPPQGPAPSTAPSGSGSLDRPGLRP